MFMIGKNYFEIAWRKEKIHFEVFWSNKSEACSSEKKTHSYVRKPHLYKTKNNPILGIPQYSRLLRVTMHVSIFLIPFHFVLYPFF